MKRSVESNDESNVSNVSSNSEAKRPKIDHHNNVDLQKFSKIVLNNGSFQQVVEKDGKYSLQKYEGSVSIGSFWFGWRRRENEGDEDVTNFVMSRCIANIEDWAVHNQQIFQQIFMLEKKEEGAFWFKNIFTDLEFFVGAEYFGDPLHEGISLYLLPESLKDALVEKDKKKRLEEESKLEWAKHLYKVAVDNDGQFVSRPLWKIKSHDLHIGSFCGFREFLGTFWLLKEKEDVLKNRINNVQTWGVSRIYTLKSVSDKGCCVLKNIHTDRVYRCPSILLFIRKFNFLPNNIKTFLVQEQHNSKELFVPLFKNSCGKKEEEVVLFYDGKCKNVRVMLHDIVLTSGGNHKMDLGMISDIFPYYDDDKMCWTAVIYVAGSMQKKKSKIYATLGQNSIQPTKLKKEEIQFIRRPGGTFTPPNTPMFYYYPTPGMKHVEYQPKPVRKGHKVKFRPVADSEPSSFRVVSVNNYGADGIIVQSWADNRKEYFAKISDVTFENFRT